MDWRAKLVAQFNNSLHNFKCISGLGACGYPAPAAHQSHCTWMGLARPLLHKLGSPAPQCSRSKRTTTKLWANESSYHANVQACLLQHHLPLADERNRTPKQFISNSWAWGHEHEWIQAASVTAAWREGVGRYLIFIFRRPSLSDCSHGWVCHSFKLQSPKPCTVTVLLL